MLIVFDRLFGSFVEEKASVPVRYGLTQPLHSYNPLRIALNEWAKLGRELRAVRSVQSALRLVFGPP